MVDELNDNVALPWLKWVVRNRVWLLLALTILFVAAVRVHLRQMPLERDEGEYAYAGQLILQGVAPYKEVYNMKLPGTYGAYALIMAVFGQTPAGIHLGVMLVNVASILLVFLLGRKLLDDVAGVVAAVSFALLSLSPSVLGLAGHATHFVVLPALAGTLVLVSWVMGEGRRTLNVELRTSNFERRGALFLSGLLFGLAFLMKQHGVFFGIFGGLYLVWTRLCEKTESGEWKAESRKRRAESGGREPVLRAAPARRLNAIQMKRMEEGNPKPEGRDPQLGSSTFAALPAQLSQELQGRALEPRTTQPASDVQSSEFEVQSSKFAVSSPPSIPHPPPSILAPLSLYSAGCVLPYALTCLVLGWAGVFHEFVFWTVSYAGRYASTVPAAYGVQVLRRALDVVVGPNLLLWLLPVAGVLSLWWGEWKSEIRNPKSETNSKSEGLKSKPSQWAAGDGHPSPERITHQVSRFTHHASTLQRLPAPRFFLITLLAASLASVSVGFHFREHYFITLLPVLSLLTGVAVSRAWHLLLRGRSVEHYRAEPVVGFVVLGFGTVVIGLFALALGAAVVGNGWVWFATPEKAEWNVYGTTLFTESARLAEFIKAQTPKDARITVVGSEPEIYFLSSRHSATGYIYTYPLMEKQDLALEMQEKMAAEIERGKPEYVVYVKDDLSWLQRPFSERKIFDWWDKYWAANLELVNTVKIDQMGDDKAGGAGADRYLLLLKRKAGG